MLFVLQATDAENSAKKRAAMRKKHLARLRALQAKRHLMSAGPNPLLDDDTQFSGSLIVTDFISLNEAQAWVRDDHYLHAGVQVLPV